MRHGPALALLITASLACGDDTVSGPTIPDITGEWVGSWTFVAQGSDPPPTTIECPGSIDVAEQTGPAFEGSVLIDGDLCSFPPLPIDGEVDEEGNLRFTLNLVQSCTITEGDADFTGAVQGNGLAVTNSVVADCGEGGPLSISTSFAGSRPS